MKRILFATLLLLVAAPAFAQQDRGETKPKEVYDPNQKIDFERPVVIRGEVDRPLIKLINVRATETFESMIPDRKHFKTELAGSLDKLAN